MGAWLALVGASVRSAAKHSITERSESQRSTTESTPLALDHGGGRGVGGADNPEAGALVRGVAIRNTKQMSWGLANGL